MDAQVLARWQFGITTVYHFFFVPITIGMTWMIAIMQTLWLRTRNPQWLQLTKFFGKLFLINFTAGVVTGIVQEFQFGLNWSEYSRFVGDIFGAPLALEALIAFFLESVFIGVWIFGWDRLPKGLHLASIYLTAAGSTLSAIFILAANCWMQNPVGATYRNGRAELTDFMALLTNPFFLTAFPHQIGASLMVAGGLIAGVGGWKMAKLVKARKVAAEPDGATTADSSDTWTPATDKAEVASTTGNEMDTWRKASRMGAWLLIFSGLLTFISGHVQGQVEGVYQPMKLAASEGIVNTTDKAPFAIVGLYTDHGNHKVFSIDVPYVVSILAKNDPNATIQGIVDLKKQYEQDGYLNDNGEKNELQAAFADDLRGLPVETVPNVNVSFYSFRLMIGLGVLAFLIGAGMLWLLRKDRQAPTNRWWLISMACLPFMPLFGNSFGWILTEMGRQPWIVYGVLPTWTAVSPGVSAGEVLFSMSAFTLVYGIIAVIVFKLFLMEIRDGLPEVKPAEPVSGEQSADAPLSFAY